MKTLFNPYPGLFTAIVVSLSLCHAQEDPNEPTPVNKKDSRPLLVLAKGKPVSFTKEVKPVLETHCLKCHNDQSNFAGIKFHTREQILEATKPNRPILIPGNARNSSFYLVTSLPGYFVEAMPAQGHRLTEDEKDIIYRWIEQGAKWPEGIRLETAKGVEIIKNGTL